MQTVATDKNAFDRPYDPISASGMLRHAVDTDANFNDMLNGVQPFDRMLNSPSTELAITADTLAAPTLQAHTVAAESGTSDVLSTIPARNNTILFLKAKAGHTIALSVGTGNISSGIDVSLSGNRMAKLVCQGGQWGIVGMNRPKSNTILVTTDPGSSADALAGYSVGSLWINTTLGRAWECVDSTSGAAIWKLISPWKNNFELHADGIGAIQGVGTLTSEVGSGSRSVSTDNDNPWATLNTNTGLTDLFYFASASAAARAAYDPLIEIYVKTVATIVDRRFWIGLFSTAPNDADALTAATKAIAWRYSAGVDAGWTPILNDGTTQTAGTTIGTVAVSTVYKLRIRIASAGTPTAYFSVNDGAEQAVTTNFPAIATDLGVYIAIGNQTAAAHVLNFGRAFVGW